jgi:hypothetical protein
MSEVASAETLRAANGQLQTVLSAAENGGARAMVAKLEAMFSSGAIDDARAFLEVLRLNAHVAAKKDEAAKAKVLRFLCARAETLAEQLVVPSPGSSVSLLPQLGGAPAPRPRGAGPAPDPAEGGAGGGGAPGPGGGGKHALMARAKKNLGHLLDGGRWESLEARMIELIRRGEIDAAFLEVLQLNIAAARTNRWTVKLQVLTRLYDRVQEELLRVRKAHDAAAANAAAESPAGAGPAHPNGGAAPRRRHAPAFAGPDLGALTPGAPPAGEIDTLAAAGQEPPGSGHGGSRVVGPAQPAEATEAFVDADRLARMLLGEELERVAPASRDAGASDRGAPRRARRGPRKKAGRRKQRARWSGRVGAVARALDRNGWAVADGFLPVEVVKEVVAEFRALQPHFRESEIWVGKSATIGAHVRAPEVRGDRVLWMCGGHDGQRVGRRRGEKPQRGNQTGWSKEDLYDAAGPRPQQRGAVEPCEPSIRGAMETSRFVALRAVIRAVDALVGEVKDRVASLGGLAERSDCMMSVYDDGARFQSHVDNTTGDGRRLTALCYLNPGWRREDGGALRVHPAADANPAADATAADATAGSSATAAGATAAEIRNSTAAEIRNSTAGSSASPPAGGPVDVYPEAGRLVLFFSDRIKHEVRPSFAPRYAFTIWYYDEAERVRALEAARGAPPRRGEKGDGDETSGRGGGAPGSGARGAPADGHGGGVVRGSGGASREDRAAASAFVARLVGPAPAAAEGGGSVPGGGLSAAAEGLSGAARSLVASIVGAPSDEALLSALRRLERDPDALAALRGRFARMGV